MIVFLAYGQTYAQNFIRSSGKRFAIHLMGSTSNTIRPVIWHYNSQNRRWCLHCRRRVGSNCNWVKKWYWGDQDLDVKTESRSIELENLSALISIYTSLSHTICSSRSITRIKLWLVSFSLIDIDNLAQVVTGRQVLVTTTSFHSILQQVFV